MGRWIGCIGIAICGALSCASLPGQSEEPPGGPAGERVLILVSLDGFRWDYLDPEQTPNLAGLARRGVRAEGLIPVFPSKTFPSHYSIVTGLHPGRHGIISNNMWDRAAGREFHLSDREAVTDPSWWGGEPIWRTAGRAGLTTAAMFWPGSEGEIAGSRPTYWHPFESDFPFRRRVAQVLEWIDLPAKARPRLVTLYFGEPNESGHAHGPDSPRTRAAVRRVDGLVGDLVRGLEDRGILASTDLVIVSDHGMAPVSAERTIYLDDYVELERGELFEQGALVQIFPHPGREESLYRALRGAHPHLEVYRRAEIPERYHLAENPRTPPILGIPEAGWEAVLRSSAKGWSLKGDHGQPPTSKDLYGLFIAAGPSFRRGLVVAPFVNVEVYNVLAAALGVEPAPNDGASDLAQRLLER